MFNIHEFHAVQCQHCKDLLAEAEHERLVLAAEQAHASGENPGVSRGILTRISGMIRSRE